MKLTTKQLQILDVLVRGNPDGSFCDLDQLLDRLPYDTTKSSMTFSIRALLAKELIILQPKETRRGKARKIISPTKLGYDMIRGSGDPYS